MQVAYIYVDMIFCFILVEPAVPGNVGASARAIKTMGFSHLRLVNPCSHLNREAKMFAHGSTDILEKAELFPDLKTALQDIDLSIASTAKPRDLEYLPLENLPGSIRSKGRTVRRVAVVFGREESGLNNAEIQQCDLVSGIRLKQPHPSLNLSHAVMLYAYILAGLQERAKEEFTSPAGEGEFRILMERSKEFLGRIGVDRNPALYNRLLERLAKLEEQDVHLVLSVLARIP